MSHPPMRIPSRTQTPGTRRFIAARSHARVEGLEPPATSFRWRWILTALAVALLTSQVSAQVDPVRQELARFDGHFDRALPWLASLYDPQSGGFFESAATRDDPELGPDIQSTAQALRIARIAGVPEADMPADIRAAFVAFFRSRQDPETGYFIDPHYRERMRDNTRVLGRALNYAAGTLRRLGAEPRFPLPGSSGDEDTDEQRVPAHVRSVEAWKDWLKRELGENPGWREMDSLQSQGSLLRGLPESRRTELIDAACDYIEQRQNPDTGLWGGELDGAFKAAAFFHAVDRPIPRADRILESTLRWFDDNPRVEQTPRLGNPARLLRHLDPHLSEPMADEDLHRVVAWYVEASGAFRKDDGGFSRWPDSFRLRPNDMQVGRVDQPQSDVNGTMMVFRARSSLYRLAEIEHPALPGAETFWKMLLTE